MIASEHGHTYATVRGSDLERDGMFLELKRDGGPAIAEIFYSDQTLQFTFTQFSPEPIPLSILQQLINEAQLCLPPAEGR
jgi:hypothetical protein